jgi:hypothetical protein
MPSGASARCVGYACCGAVVQGRRQGACAATHGARLRERAGAARRQPETLLAAVEAVLGAYGGSRGAGTLLGQASAMVDPLVITRLGELRDSIRRDFL